MRRPGFTRVLIVSAVSLVPGAAGGSELVEIRADVVEDKIRGGLLGQLLGNLNGLSHEMKYLAEPGNVASYTPALPDGARTDDDTDIEWTYLIEMQRSGGVLIPPRRIAELWKAHISGYVWCANLYARHLMDLAIAPPLTGRIALNPWSQFNISGQFVSESFGLIAPAMPRTAAKIGLHYTHVTIDGEPAQATQLVDAMIATAFVENDVEAIVAAGLAAVDPDSEIRRVVRDVRQWWKEDPSDWRATRRRIRDKYTRHGGGMRDNNGYELNTAAIIGSLLHARGDFVETIRLGFNFGWDADCNAATAATVVGVIKGRRWMDDQGWMIRDDYRNTTRPGLPTDETITRFGDRLAAVAKMVILDNGGEEITRDGARIFRIRVEKPANVEPLPKPLDRLEEMRLQLLPAIKKDLSGWTVDRARAAYLALCLAEADTLIKDRPDEWKRAVQALHEFPDLINDLFKAPQPSGAELQARARAAGLKEL